MCQSKAEGGRRCKGKKGRGALAALGGTGTTGSTGSSAPSRPSGRRRRSREAVLRDAQQQLSDLLDVIINAGPGAPAATAVSAADAYVAGQVADAITATLEAHGAPRGKWTSHLLCGALAAVAHAMQAGEDLAKAAVAEGVTAALTACGMPRLPARLAGRAAAGKLLSLTPLGHWAAVRRAVQLQAVAACPDVTEHPEVENHCVRPLASEALSSAIQEELAESLPAGALR
jgi:hypothetical protein